MDTTTAHDTGQPLGRAFARGWNKLPDKLKVEILIHNLVQPMPIKMNEYSGYITNGRHLVENLWHHSFTTPEIDDLSVETLYNKNTFSLILPTSHYKKTAALIYPVPQFAHLVRSVILNQYGWTCWGLKQ
jgi:hypothetical protein